MDILKIKPEIKRAIRKYVLKSFSKKSETEQEKLIEQYCQQVADADNTSERIMILQSYGYFKIDKEGNFVGGSYAD